MGQRAQLESLQRLLLENEIQSVVEERNEGNFVLVIYVLKHGDGNEIILGNLDSPQGTENAMQTIVALMEADR
ncbi:MAG: hypothetical protein ABH881_02690 [bacterium]